MKKFTAIISWASDYLTSQGYPLNHAPEIIIETPWSSIICFQTSNGKIYLKKTPPGIFLETNIIQFLAELNADVPRIIASNQNLHCFLMRDAGINLRQLLKKQFNADLFIQCVTHYATIQRLAENYIEPLLALGVPDWRLDKLPKLYDQLIHETEFLQADGMTEDELQRLSDLTLRVAEQCNLLAHYQIPETIVQPDFNTNNMLFDPTSKKMTLIDLGELAITHPFFSFPNFMTQATYHHDVQEHDLLYQQLQNTYYENWSSTLTRQQFIDILNLIKKLCPIYSALASYRLMTSVDLNAFKIYYAARPNRLAHSLREYLTSR